MYQVVWFLVIIVGKYNRAWSTVVSEQNYLTVCDNFYFILSRNLLFLKNYSGNVEDLSLNFTVVNNDLGESQVSQTKQPNSTTPFNKLWFLKKTAGFSTFVIIMVQSY